MPEVKICDRCKKEVVNPDALFCGYCGFQLVQKEEGEEQEEQNDFQQTTTSNVAPSLSIASNAQNYGQGVKTREGGMRTSPAGYDQAADYLNSAAPMYSGLTQVKYVTGQPLFRRKNIPYIIGHIVAAFVSFIMRFLLLKDQFPPLSELAISLGYYTVFIGVLFYIQIAEYRKHGVEPKQDIDKFDITSSMVISSFFFSTISHSYTMDEERSTLPDKLTVLVEVGKPPKELSKKSYYEEYVKPKVIKKRYFYTLVAGYFTWLLMSSSLFPETDATKLFIQYIGAYSFLEVAPAIGRNTDHIIGKKRWVSFIFIILSAGLIVLGSIYSIQVPQV